jgi:ATP-dependent exoDNAse (exonuclease V) beta subunit
MARSLQDVKKGEQIIRISEFNTLISTLIREEDAPFIYERLGNKFDHFLLDEFQDTSHLQWLNLIPLIHETLSNYKKNLIVGDPKQSIYRFKNGVAEQFIELPGIYNPDQDPFIENKSAYFKDSGRVDELLDNWRSSEIIVNFNNKFFERFRETMGDTAKSFYSSIKQNSKKNLTGKVDVVSKAEKTSNSDLIPKIVDQIEECLADGFNPNDICILGARNKDCNQWAMELHDLGYKVVSTDSLLIQSDLEVQLTVAYLQWRYRPSGSNEMKRFGELYMRITKQPYSTYKSFIKEIELESGHTIRVFDDKEFIRTYFDEYHKFFFKYENLYDLVQGFIRIAGFNELMNPYLHHLSDVVFTYGQKNGPDLKGFLDEYEKTKDKIAVQIPESDDALQIMTIHKSKGLEFPVVIVPSIDMGLDIKSNFFVELDDKIIYKTPSKNDILKPLKELHEHESEQVLIDCINMCYVALTRPKERLYITNQFDGGKFGAKFHDILSKMEGIVTSEGELSLTLSDGTRSETSEGSGGDLFKPQTITDKLWFPDIALQDNDELYNEKFMSTEMQFGQQFHLLASLVYNKTEIDPTVDKLIEEGEIDLANKDQLKKKLNELLGSDEYKELFIGAESILNEQSILLENADQLRPDLIIVKPSETILLDFKTGIPKSKDVKQVKQYKELLEQMGYPNIKGYLFYSVNSELQPVV